MAEAQAAPAYASDAVAADVVHLADAVRRQLVARPRPARRRSRPRRTAMPPPAADRARAKVTRLQGDLGDARRRRISTRTRIIASTPSFSKRSTTAGAAAGPSPRIWTLLGAGGGSVSWTRLGPDRARGDGERSSIATFLAFIRPGTLG